MPQIKTFCRIKPTPDYYPEFEVSQETLYLRVPEVLRDFTSTNKSRGAVISHEFKFNYIFNNTATQEEVFDEAAKDIVDGFLNGYNGTIFAYGQTGTGKTFTVEGGSKSYAQRGLQPRAISMIYKELEKRQDEDISVHISYLEIYKEVGYDLLNPGARTQSVVTPFPKVNVLEGASGVWVVRNLSVHYAASEDVAQNLLLQGQANRRVAATTVHDRSSRSHAVFTVQLSAKQPDSDVIIKSKLHLVDLAGSERVSKTGAGGHLLEEARSINLSLHFLETVIISLQGESSSNNNRIGSAGLSRSQSFRHSRHGARPSSADLSAPKHVPYRNSLLTMVLRDSLGGNCLTAMIATTSLEIENIGESISTCRFAGRVACIANSVSRNEEVDEKTLIKKLRKRVAELETELSCMRAARETGANLSIEEMNAKLTDEDKILCGQVVSRYLGGQLKDPVTAGITSPYKFRECLKILKRVITDGNHNILDHDYPQITQGVPDGYHSADEAVHRKRKEKVSREQPSKRHTELGKMDREKTVDFPITNAWDNPIVEPEPKPRQPQRPRQQPHRNVTNTNSTKHPAIPVVDDLAQTTTEETNNEQPQEERVKPERTLSQMLVSKSRRGKYQSPFEQKRVKEIKKLNTKVETLQQAQLEKEGELVEMKIGLAEQELDIVEEQIRNKLNVTKEQVDDQHAYVTQLETTEADPSLIEREKLVEKQLRRRQSKFDKKLEVLEEKRNQLQKHSEEFQEELQSVEKPTMKEQYGKYRNRDGSLNTRQVFEMLKTQEKKQEKVHTEIDHEKAWIYNKHLEMREAATREKLKQFKEMLRMSRTTDGRGYVSEEEGHRTTRTAPGHLAANGEYNVPQNKDRAKTSDVHPTTRQTARTQYMAPPEPPGTRQTEPPGTRQTTRTHFTTVPYNDIPQTRQTVRTEYSESLVNDNVPGTSQTNRTTVSNNLDGRPGSSKSMRSIPDSDFYAQKKRDKDPTSRWESSYSRPSTAQSVRFDLGNGQTVLPNGLPVENGAWPTENGVGMTDDFKSSSRKSQRKQTAYESEPEIVNGYESDPRDTVMPSEYVYGMGAGDKFDGRKMGLSSQTFDAALANMLEREDQNVYYDYDDYDQYARTGGNPKTNSRKARVQSPYYTSPYPLSGSAKQPRDVRQGRSPVRKGRSPDSRGMSQERGRSQGGGSRSRDRAGGSRERAGGSRERQTNWSDDEAMLESLMRAHQQESRGRSRGRSQSQERRPEVKYSQEDSDIDLWPNSRTTKAWGPEARQASIHAKLGMQTPEKKQRRKPRKRAKAKRTLDENLKEYDQSNLPGGKKGQLVWEESPAATQVTALPEEKAEDVFMTKVQQQKDRVNKIRKARASAEVIQRTWRRYAAKKKVQKMRMDAKKK